MAMRPISLGLPRIGHSHQQAHLGALRAPRLVACSLIQNRQFRTASAFRVENTGGAAWVEDGELQSRARKNENRRPWHRHGADEPPVKAEDHDPPPEMQSDPTKGKLLTTPTHLLKLILPLPFHVRRNPDTADKDQDQNTLENDSLQPLALLVHPHQPLSYIERLIQAELPPTVDAKGNERLPNVSFRAEDTEHDKSRETSSKQDGKRDNDDVDEGETEGGPGKMESRSQEDSGHKGPGVAQYSGLGRLAEPVEEHERRWVRWSSSTEIGDFIRDAARGREFSVDISSPAPRPSSASSTSEKDKHEEGQGQGITSILVAVPSFADRTHYPRTRLRRLSGMIAQQSRVKRECDAAAHKGAHRLAQGGFAAMSGWWLVVYYTTFHTTAGWDLVEPVTYLAGLTTIMGGYLWFLYISRDLSYKGAMNITVSRRQNALYHARGFDLARWEELVRQANDLRTEIRMVAEEYDVDWDERKDLVGGKKIQKLLENEAEKAGKDDKDDDDSGDKKSKRQKSSRATEEGSQEGKNSKTDKQDEAAHDNKD